jgi:predicted enzyme related to lactoylglutathione lyase
MTVITKHAPGTFCWAELATSNQAAATTFYTRLFGWTHRDSPMPDGTTYTMLEMGGGPVAALYPQNPKMTPPGTPPNWLAYLAVENADQTAAKVKATGGQVMAPPFDVQQFGRMAVCADNLGAVFAIWQAGTHPGIARTQEPGALSWVQLNAGDPGAAAMFYQAVFGWAHRRDPMPQGGEYITWMTGGQQAGGGMPMPPGANAPAHWLLYFGSADVDATSAKAVTLGGKTLVPPMDIPGTGRFAVLADPQGAVFAIVKFSM